MDEDFKKNTSNEGGSEQPVNTEQPREEEKQVSPSSVYEEFLHGDEDEDFDTSKIDEVEKAVTEEDVDNLLAELEGESPEEPEKDDKDEESEKKDKEPPKGEGEGGDNDDEPEGKSKDNPPEEDTPPDESDKGFEPDKDTVYEINDEFIEKYPDDADKKILEKMRGMKLDGKALKMLINAERMVGKKSSPIKADEESGDSAEDPLAIPVDEENPIPKEIPVPKALKENKELSAKIDAEVVRELRKMPEFEDLPENLDEVKEWMQDINVDDPERFHKFLNERERVRENLYKVVARGVYIENNAEKINNALLKKEVNSIIKEFEELEAADFVKQDFDFTLMEDESGLLRNKLLEDLMFTDESKKQLDPRVVTFVGKKPVLVEGGLKSKFIEKYGKAIIKKAIAEGRRKERVKEFEQREQKAKKTLHSSATQSPGVAVKKLPLETAIDQAKEQATLDEIIKQIEESVS